MYELLIKPSVFFANSSYPTFYLGKEHFPAHIYPITKKASQSTYDRGIRTVPNAPFPQKRTPGYGP